MEQKHQKLGDGWTWKKTKLHIAVLIDSQTLRLSKVNLFFSGRDNARRSRKPSSTWSWSLEELTWQMNALLHHNSMSLSHLLTIFFWWLSFDCTYCNKKFNKDVANRLRMPWIKLHHYSAWGRSRSAWAWRYIKALKRSSVVTVAKTEEIREREYEGVLPIYRLAPYSMTVRFSVSTNPLPACWLAPSQGQTKSPITPRKLFVFKLRDRPY